MSSSDGPGTAPLPPGGTSPLQHTSSETELWQQIRLNPDSVPCPSWGCHSPLLSLYMGTFFLCSVSSGICLLTSIYSRPQIMATVVSISPVVEPALRTAVLPSTPSCYSPS